jgi:glycosyltransferase involved in cell wall biosynthesis
MKPQLSVVIPTYNRLHLLKRTLASLLTQDIAPESFEVLVVSDGSTDDTHDYLNTFCQKHPFSKWTMQQNQGPSSARNFGLSQVKSPLIAFTDDDCLADPGWIQSILDMFNTQPNILGMEGKTVTIPEETTPLTHQLEGSGQCYATANVAYRREALQEVAGFDPAFFYGNEDVDVAWRVMEQGPVVYNEHMVIIHPPLPRTLYKFIRKPETYGVEILLYKKHPERYLQQKHHKPLYVIYSSIGIRYLPQELGQCMPLVLKRPVLAFKSIIGLLMQRVWLILLVPRFLSMYFGIIKRNQTYVS